MLPSFSPALLALEDGTIFRGRSFGIGGYTTGEIVFNTSITGYQEILTDPSYTRQIVTFTYPHIGNVGVNEEDIEASKVYASGLVVRDLPVHSSSFRETCTLESYLKSQKVLGITDIDTRCLTRLLRDRGSQQACLLAGEDDSGKAVALARSSSSLSGIDLIKDVSSQKSYTWQQTEWKFGFGYRKLGFPNYKVVVIDYGTKYNILRMLAGRGCDVIVLPAQSTIEEVLSHRPDGICLSNGPGDPQPCSYAITMVKEIIEKNIPTFGICFGHQIMALAVGAKTVKMRTGHHGANHPVKDLDDGRVVITSQNHGFVVDIHTLPSNARVTHISLFDETLQGFALIDKPTFSFQGHPEASPGPTDIAYLFDRFISLIAKRRISAIEIPY